MPVVSGVTSFPRSAWECGTLDALRHSLETNGNARALAGDRVHQRTRKAASLIPVERGLNIFGRFGNWLKELLRKKPGPPTGTGGLKILWLSWEQYPKVTIGGQEYARVGNRLYTYHAVERTYPSGLGTAVGGVKGRSVAPRYIEEVLTHPNTTRTPVTGPHGEARVSHVFGSLEVITEGNIVITVITH